jgi:hypothetical protein
MQRFRRVPRLQAFKAAGVEQAFKPAMPAFLPAFREKNARKNAVMAAWKGRSTVGINLTPQATTSYFSHHAAHDPLAPTAER